MSKVVFVTGNPEKAMSFARHIGMEIAHEPAELDEIQTTNHKELVEHKVRQAYDQLKCPVIVEDVFFTYEAWGSLPGPFVKFFVNEEQGPERMCRMLDGFENRRAIAACMIGYFDGKKMKLIEGSISGVVAEHPRGAGGYGFDRVFEPDGFNGSTAAELEGVDYDKYYATIKPFAELREFLQKSVE